ncbi:MAG: alanine--tRNA ligase [Candidatus Azosocius agrarius]|nr:MAG: alanine--tRNA ligase [Gammaproteobacteria bacterium]
MKFLYSYEIQFLFLDYFKKNKHKIIEGSSIVSSNDNSLLFTNSGMVQFKDFFLGNKNIVYENIATSQSCIRAGGKHNDLSNVGYTSRHHTLFQMLGNFSFGGYFKNEAIFYAWFFLTHILFIFKDKLFITVYEKDFESECIWLKSIKINKNNLIKLGKKDNFWMMGNYGPCGPCTEIFYDHGPLLKGEFNTNENFCDRYIEIWNLVFMEFNVCKTEILNLLKPCIDTGMGLERISAVMQGVNDNYDIDIFKSLKNLIIKTLFGEKLFIYDIHSINVISDHLRSSSLIIFNGILPSNDGRSYVLRKIIRRAIIHGKKINVSDEFLYKLFKVMVNNVDYDYLLKSVNDIGKVLFEEEVKFNETLNQGLKKLNEIISFNNKKICGKDAFILYDTYGFPIDLTIEISREYDVEVDVDDFYKYMFLQKNINVESNKFCFNNSFFKISNFIGYNFLNYISKVKKIIIDNKLVNMLQYNNKGILILDNSTFYYESGGQIGDKGFFLGNNFVFFVENVKNINGIYMHFGIVMFGFIKIGDFVKNCVDYFFRRSSSSNHSATHIVNYVLRKVLSKNIKQVGSYINNHKLRFDFLYNGKLSNYVNDSIENIINQYILSNLFIKYDLIDFVEVKNKDIIYLSDDNYDSKVRVVYIGNALSSELCAGTHVKFTGDIGSFKILSLINIAAGVKRLEAVTGLDSLIICQKKFNIIESIKLLLKCEDNLLNSRIDDLIIKNSDLNKKMLQLKKNILLNIEDSIFKSVIFLSNTCLLIKQLFVGTINLLKDIVLKYKKYYFNGIIILIIFESDTLNIIISITNNLEFIFNSVLLIKYFFMKIGGFGGGNKFNALGGIKSNKNVIDINYILKNNFEFLKRCVI